MKIKIEANTSHYASCTCCGNREGLYSIKMETANAYTTNIIDICEKHLIELKNEITKSLTKEINKKAQPMTVEQQENTIIQARMNQKKTLEKIRKAKIEYKKDCDDYNKIVECESNEKAIALYWDLDTAARETIIHILKG